MSSPLDARRQRLSDCGLEQAATHMPPLVISAANQPKGNFYDPYIRSLTPRDLDHLKQVAGVPNSVHTANGAADTHRYQVAKSHLPNTDTFAFDALSEEQQEAVRQMAYNLVYGYADPKEVAKGGLKGVTSYLLNTVGSIPVLYGSDLTVEDGQTWECPAPVVYFDNITVIGSGSIVVQANQKVVAQNVIHQ